MILCLLVALVGLAHAQPEVDLTLVDSTLDEVTLSSTENPAQSGSTLRITLHGPEGLTCCGCEVNGVTLDDSLEFAHHEYTLTYSVMAGDPAWAAGELPLSLCLMKGQVYMMVTDFTDNNLVEGDVHDPTLADYAPVSLKVVGGFLFSLFCSYVLGYGLKILHLPLPMVTAYLMAGIISGPYCLAFIEEDQIRSLRFFDELCLAFIALSAGSKMHCASLRDRLKPIASVSLCLVIFEYSIAIGIILALAPYVEFMHGMSSKQELAVATLAGALVLARSPASAIAIIREIGASGPFTSLMLGVTIVMDLVVIELFSLTMLGVRLGLEEESDTAWKAMMLPIVTLLISLSTGVLVAILLRYILWEATSHVYHIRILQGVLVLALGFMTVIGSHFCAEYMDPLLACMAAGFLVVNFTDKREKMTQVEEDLSETVYLILFTLTGAALAFDALGGTLLISLAIFAARVVGIGFGSFVGGTIVGEPAFQNRVAWMGYITQAGVTLGLAKKVHLEYSSWGPQFATTIVAVVVLNQIIGPPMLKLVVRLVREDRASRNHSCVWLVGDSDLVFTRLPGLLREHRSSLDRGAKQFEVRCICADSLMSTVAGGDEQSLMSSSGASFDFDFDAVNKAFAQVSSMDCVILLIPEDQGHALAKHFRSPTGGQFPKATRVVVGIQSISVMPAIYEAGALPVMAPDALPADEEGFLEGVLVLLSAKPEPSPKAKEDAAEDAPGLKQNV